MMIREGTPHDDDVRLEPTDPEDALSDTTTNVATGDPSSSVTSPFICNAHHGEDNEATGSKRVNRRSDEMGIKVFCIGCL